MTPEQMRALANRITDRNGVAVLDMDAAAAALRATADQLEAVQTQVDTYMQKVASRVIDVFESADEDATAEDVMPDVFAAIGLLQHHGVTADTAPQEDRDE